MKKAKKNLYGTYLLYINLKFKISAINISIKLCFLICVFRRFKNIVCKIHVKNPFSYKRVKTRFDEAFINLYLMFLTRLLFMHQIKIMAPLLQFLSKSISECN